MRSRFVTRRLQMLLQGLLALALMLVGFSEIAHAQDPFEIRVEQYEKPVLGGFTFEEHVNYVQIGTANADGTVAPTNHQFHMSSELTGGITNNLSLGLMLLTSTVPGRRGHAYAGWRVLPHFFVPASWKLPVKAGLTAEFSFQQTMFDESASTIELRPIIEKSFGPAQFDINPAIERALSGQPAHESWTFEPSLRFAYQINPRFSPTLEYFGMVGPLGRFLRLNEEVHQIYPGGAVGLTQNVQWDMGVGVALTPAGNELVYKARVEFVFGRHAK